MKFFRRETILLGVILLVALALRVWGVAFDLPYVYHSDEPTYITISQNIFKSGDLNPHFFNYPTLFFYINALAYAPYYLYGHLTGALASPSDIVPPTTLAMGVTHAALPGTVLLGRIVTICFGVGTVGLAFIVGKQLTGRAAVGLLAALMLAVSPTNVWHSRQIAPDTFVTFFALAAFSAALLVYQQGKVWQYALAGICVGLAASSKYNGVLIVLPLLWAHALNYGKSSLLQPKLYLALVCCVFGFVATTPYAVLDASSFIRDVRYEGEHYAAGHPGMEGGSLLWYLKFMWETCGGLYLLAALGAIAGLRTAPKVASLLVLFPAMYLAFVSSFVVRNDRTFLPVTPYLFLLAAWFLVMAFDRINAWQPGPWRRPALVGLAAVAMVALAMPLASTASAARNLLAPNSRETARVWLADNLPPGAKVAIEAYTPFIDPKQFSVQSVTRLIVHDSAWYIGQGFEYLVCSEGMYGRFYTEPELYKKEVAQYEELFGRFTLVKSFNDGGSEVRVYKNDMNTR